MAKLLRVGVAVLRVYRSLNCSFITASHLRCVVPLTLSTAPDTLVCRSSTMPTYKLIYFESRGRAEVIRFIFAQAEVQYEDKRVTQEEWAKLKPNTPYGTLPVLEVDGKQLAGTIPIARFLAERFGLAGSNDFENADIDSIQDVATDFTIQLMLCFWEKDDAKKSELKKELQEKHCPRYLGELEKRAKTSNAPEGWLWGKLTWADLYFYQGCGYLEEICPGALEGFPTLTKLKSSVESLPKIAKWIKERPETKF